MQVLWHQCAGSLAWKIKTIPLPTSRVFVKTNWGSMYKAFLYFYSMSVPVYSMSYKNVNSSNFVWTKDSVTKERLETTLHLISLKVSLGLVLWFSGTISSLISFVPSLPPYKTPATWIKPKSNRNLSPGRGWWWQGKGFGESSRDVYQLQSVPGNAVRKPGHGFLPGLL